MSEQRPAVSSPKSDDTIVARDERKPDTYAPPSLGYSVRDHRTGLIISMLSLVFLNACAPVLVYYLVKHFTNVTNERLFGVTTAVLANSPITWPFRAWKLLRKGGERSPVPESQNGAASVQRANPKWWQKFDVFQWQFLFGIYFVTIFFVIACVANHPNGYFPLLALGPSLLVGEVGLQLVITSLFTIFKVPLPFRFSSVGKGEPWRPATYFLWEDLTAVDGGGGAEFRARLDQRYRTSPPFRSMLRDLGFLLGFGGMALVGIECGLVFSGASDDVVYGTSLAIAVAWAGVGALVGITYYKWAAKREQQWWSANGGSAFEQKM